MPKNTRLFLFLGAILLAPSIFVSGQQLNPVKPSLRPFNTQIPVPLPHVYWHFLIYQNHLDQKAKELELQGKSGHFFRNYFQTKLGWSDADFAPIRTASVQLSSTLKDLDKNAVALRSVAAPITSSRQSTLVAQRESDINAQIAFIKQRLPPEKIEALEGFLVPYFAPKNIFKSTQINQAK